MKNLVFAALLVMPLSLTAGVTHALTLTSPTLTDNGLLPTAHVYNQHVCTGQNLSPALQWNGAPAEVKSFAVTMYDPDASPNVGFWHWAVFDIPPDITGLSEGIGTKGALPAGALEATNDFKQPGYGGACPPKASAAHRYVVTVYALRVPSLALPAGAPASAVDGAIQANKMAEARLTATYGR